MPESPDAPTLAELSEALVGAAPDLDDLGRRVVVATYHLLAGGEPVPDGRIAEAVGADVAEVSGRLRTWPGVFRDADDHIVGFWGLAIAPLDPEYRLLTPGAPDLFAWCAWDTLFLPVVLGRALEVRAADGQSGDPISVSVGPDGLRSVDPPGTVVSFVVPDGRFDADVITGFCHKVLFFADRDHATRWMNTRRDDLFALPIDDAFEVGRRVVRSRYRDALPD